MGAAADRAYEYLRDGIFRGVFPVGMRLAEEHIAAQVGASRSPVRDALRHLADEGLVDLIPNRGAVVARWDAGEVETIFEIRALLESYAASRAASRISVAEVAKLEELCDAAETLMNEWAPRHAAQIADINQEFHRVILGSTQSRRLHSSLQGVIRVPLLRGLSGDGYLIALNVAALQHREIVRALKHGDRRWAAVAMEGHIRAALGAQRNEQSNAVDGTEDAAASARDVFGAG